MAANETRYYVKLNNINQRAVISRWFWEDFKKRITPLLQAAFSFPFL